MHGFTYQVLSIDILPDVRLPFLLTSIYGRIVSSLYTNIFSYWSTISIIYLLLLTIYEKSRKDSIRNLKDISK